MSEVPAIQISKVSKHFRDNQAVRSVSLEVQPGDILAIIGPNGAGKSTLIKLMVGLYTPSNGAIYIDGFNIETQPLNAKSVFGYVSDDPTVYDYLSGEEFLTLTGRLHDIPSTELKHRISELVHIFPLNTIIQRPMSEYSRGNRQKVAFLAALLAKPRVLIIDEPIVGLDPTSIEIFGKTLKAFVREGGAVLLATHILAFAQEYANRVGIMHKGHLVREEKISTKTSLEKLYHQYTHETAE